MNLIAHTNDGIKWALDVQVKKIAVLIDRKWLHSINAESVEYLIKEAEKYNMVQIYHCPNSILDGRIDACPETPLYSNGQRDVYSLELDGKIIWKRK